MSQVSRAAADAGLRLFVVLLAADGSPGQRESAWHLVMALFMLPCVLLAPVNGALSNSLPKRGLLVASAAYLLAVLMGYGLIGSGGSAAAAVTVALVAMGSAVYGPTRFALLPATARDTGWPLSRVTAGIESGAVLAMVLGMLGVAELVTRQDAQVQTGPAPALLALWGLSLVCLLTALPAWFESDVRRPEPPWAALRGFFADGRRILANPPACSALIGIAALRGIVAVAVGALIAAVLARQDGDTAASFRLLLAVALLAMLGTGLGSLLAGLVGERRVGRWLVPIGAAGLALSLAWVAQAPGVPLEVCVLIGVFGGMVNVPLLVAYQVAIPADARGNGMSILSTAGYLSMSVLSLGMAALSALRVVDASGQLILAAALAAVAAIAAWTLAARLGLVQGQTAPPA